MLKSFFPLLLLSFFSIQCSTDKGIAVRSSNPATESQPEESSDHEKEPEESSDQEKAPEVAETLDAKIREEYHYVRSLLGPDGRNPISPEAANRFCVYIPHKEAAEIHHKSLEKGFISEDLSDEIWNSGYFALIVPKEKKPGHFVAVLGCCEHPKKKL